MGNDDKCFSWTPEKLRLLIQLLTAMLISLAGIVISTVWLLCIRIPYSKSQTLDMCELLFFISFDVLACMNLMLESSMLRQFCKRHQHMEKPQAGLEGYSALMLLVLQERSMLNTFLLSVIISTLCSVLLATACFLGTFLYSLLTGGI